jgi:hypothetical protein
MTRAPFQVGPGASQVSLGMQEAAEVFQDAADMWVVGTEGRLVEGQDLFQVGSAAGQVALVTQHGTEIA